MPTMAPIYELNDRGCHICLSHCRDKAGYPRAYDPRTGNARPLSNIVFEKHHGVSILRGYVIRHECDEPSCINVAHMIVGTRKQNAADMVARGRQSRQGARRKLSDADVVAIRASDETLHELSKRYGVGMAHLAGIRSGRLRRGRRAPAPQSLLHPGFKVHEPAAA